jgi:glycine cleavage system H protein
MSNIPDDFLYTKDDEWLRMDEDEGFVGLTDYAQDALSDIVYVELPEEGDSFDAGDAFGVIESVKAAADLYMPVSGEITAVNEDLPDMPEVVNSDPYGEGWLVKIKVSDVSSLDDLMNASAYRAYCDGRA